MTMQQTLLEELKGKDVLGYCKYCAEGRESPKPYCIYWHIPIGIEQFPYMDRCAVCYFKHGKKDNEKRLG